MQQHAVFKTSFSIKFDKPVTKMVNECYDYPSELHLRGLKFCEIERCKGITTRILKSNLVAKNFY